MKIPAGPITIDVRPGTAADVPLLMSLIRSMADFEKLPVTATEESLRTSLFGAAPAAHTLFAFVDGRPAAYVIYFYSFSSFVGKRGLWLEDLFVTPEFRGRGIGQALMAYLADLAMKQGCGRFEWMVLDWNERAIRFYKALGAEILDGWTPCRLVEDQLPAVAGRLAAL